MKTLTVVGTRPELIRLSLVIKKLDNLLGKNHILVHTGQNFNPLLKDIFFSELSIRQPDYFLEAKGSFGEQISIMFPKVEKIFEKETPDKVLILGDTNSGLCSIIAERMKIPIGHLEAGNRSYNKETPEENNRHIIDNCATINYPYTYRSRDNLIKEGFDLKYVFVTGNPIYEVLMYYKSQIKHSKILETLNLTSKEYVLVTLHRSENVDNLERFTHIIEAYNQIAKTGIDVIISTHPRTYSKLSLLKIPISEKVKFLPAFGFFDFVTLEKNAKVILTDSGTCQEDSCILKIPCVITRKATERTETIECGASILAGIGSKSIYESYEWATKMNTSWIPPIGYLDPNASDKIINHFLNSWEK